MIDHTPVAPTPRPRTPHAQAAWDRVVGDILTQAAREIAEERALRTYQVGDRVTYGWNHYAPMRSCPLVGVVVGVEDGEYLVHADSHDWETPPYRRAAVELEPAGAT